MEEVYSGSNWRIKHIFDGDFGCEERPAGQKERMVSVTLVNEKGEEKYVTVADAWLVKNGLDVGSTWPMGTGFMDHKNGLLTPSLGFKNGLDVGSKWQE